MGKHFDVRKNKQGEVIKQGGIFFFLRTFTEIDRWKHFVCNLLRIKTDVRSYGRKNPINNFPFA